MFVTVINDCSDDNEMGRQLSRFATFLSSPVIPVRIKNDLGGAGNLIDILDATGGEQGMISVNVAPRSRRAHDLGLVGKKDLATLFATDGETTDSLKREEGVKKWPNGTPFGYFHYKKTLVISTIDGYCLSMVKKYGITDTIHVFDIPTVMDFAIKQGIFPAEQRSLVVDSQFRSNEFVPRAAKWLFRGIPLPTEEKKIETFPDMPNCVWWVDNFGNCKTSLFASEVNHEQGKKLSLNIGEITCYNRLKDVPNGEAGLTVGSSGFGMQRLLEIVVQGKRGSERFGLHSGFAIEVQ